MCINKLHQVGKMFVRIVLRVITVCLRNNIEEEVVQDAVCLHCLNKELSET